MNLRYSLAIPSAAQATTSEGVALLEQQLREQGRCCRNSFRYGVAVELPSDGTQSGTDIAACAQGIVDALSSTKLLWGDPKQVEKVLVTRVAIADVGAPEIVVRIKATGEHEPFAPTYFQACCLEAKTARSSYSACGWHLAIHLGDHQPDELTQEEWSRAIDGMCTLLQNEDFELVRDWFREYLPGCTRLVPRQRLRQFVKGVLQADEEGRIR